jgi:hypothetical protein
MLRGRAVTVTRSSMLTLINPIERAEPFDRPDWPFEAKFDGFRAAADTARGQLILRNGNPKRRRSISCRGVTSSRSSCSTTPGALCSTSCRFGVAARLTWPSAL